MRTKAQFDRTPGSIIVKVKPPAAAHVAKTKRAYQDWKPVASQIIATVQTPEPAPVEKQISTPPKQSLQSLLSEVDAIMQPKGRANTEPGTRGNHYSEPGKTKTNHYSELMAYWDRKRYEKSAAEMAYRKNRKAVQ